MNIYEAKRIYVTILANFESVEINTENILAKRIYVTILANFFLK